MGKKFRENSCPKASYGEKEVYFDLEDMENTSGSWEIYGRKDTKRYPAMQDEFFNRAGQALCRREVMLAFCAISLLLQFLPGEPREVMTSCFPFELVLSSL